MSKKLNAEQTGESVVVAVRLPPDLLTGLDRVVAQSARPPFSSPTRSEVARGLIETALRSLGVLEAVATAPAPTPPKPTSAATPPKSARKAPPTPAPAPQRLPIGDAVLAALHAVEVPGVDLLDVAGVVRNLEAQGHERAAIHAELVRLGTAGVDVLELRPDSGNGNERQEDRAIVPRGLDGNPFLTARWINRPETAPSPENDSDALRVRFREALRLKKTSINKSAEPAGCSITPLRRWLNEGKALDPLFRENLTKHLDSIGSANTTRSNRSAEF